MAAYNTVNIYDDDVALSSLTQVNSSGGPSTRISDDSSVLDYKTLDISEYDESLFASSNMSGKVWTDKSVYANSSSNSNGEYTVDIDDTNSTFNTDFTEVFSALGSSQLYSGNVPIDLVLVIDNSGSMYQLPSNSDWEHRRIGLAVKSLNQSINKIMKQNPYNRVMVIAFGNGQSTITAGLQYDDAKEATASVLLPLRHYDVMTEYIGASWSYPDKTIFNYTREPNHTTSASNGYIYVKENVTYRDEYGKTQYAEKSVLSNGTTNINAGINKGLEELTKIRDKTTIINGEHVMHIPSMILLSDGAATDLMSGSWFGVEEEALGFANDPGNKLRDFDNVETLGPKNNHWNMNVEFVDGKYHQIGWGTVTADNSPLSGVEECRSLANDYRQTQANMIFNTIMNAAYMKAAVEKTYQQNCNIFTISFDITDPKTIKVPSTIGDSDAYEPSNSFMTMNPNEYLNKQFLKDAGYIKANADLSKPLTEADTTYPDYTVGSELILAMGDAIDAWEAYSENKSVSNISTYRAWDEINNLMGAMKDGRVTRSDTSTSSGGNVADASGCGEAPADIPVGPNHSNAYFWEEKQTISFEHLAADGSNNKYGLTDSDIDVNYVTNAFYVKSSATDELDTIYSKIIQEISYSSQLPVTSDGTNIISNTKGGLYYQDPIGRHMEINDIQKLALFGEEYPITAIETPDNPSIWMGNRKYTPDKVTYKFYLPAVYDSITGKYNDLQNISNPTYTDDKTFNLSDIKIWTEHKNTDDGTYNDSLNILIPPQALPIHLASITLSETGDKFVQYSSNYQEEYSKPLKVIYDIGVESALKNSDGTINLEALYRADRNYFVSHLDEETGMVSFYANYYNDDKENTQTTAFTEFTPSVSNNYYYVKSPEVIYSDSSATKTITDPNQIRDSVELYYLKDTYIQPEGSPSYDAKTHNCYWSSDQMGFYTKIIPLPGSYFTKNGTTIMSKLCWYDTNLNKSFPITDPRPNNDCVVAIAAGSPRNISDEHLFAEKTDTANKTITKKYVCSNKISNLYDNNDFNMVGYLGNNGKVSTKNTLSFYNPSVKKQMNDLEGNVIDDYDYSTNHFTFTITAENGTTPLPDPTTVITDDNGLAKWNEVIFPGPGQYEYVITEEKGNIPNISYDTEGHKLTVNVDENRNISEKWEGEYQHNKSTPIIINTYAPSTNINLSIQKCYLEKAEGTELDIHDDEFSFVLKPDNKLNDAPMPKGTVGSAITVSTDNTGLVKFPEITFTKPGEWDYIIQEEDGKIENVEYDLTEHKVHVSVTLDENHNLQAKWTLWDDTAFPGNESSDKPIITNYHITPVPLPATGVISNTPNMLIPPLAIIGIIISGITIISASFLKRRKIDIDNYPNE